jgi:SSS family solute:Na+ symporter
VATFILGLFWKKSNANGAFSSLMVGGAFAVFMILSASFDWSPYINDLHFLAKANLLFVIAVVVNVVVSLTSGKVDETKSC